MEHCYANKSRYTPQSNKENREAVRTRAACIDLVEDLSSKGVSFLLKIEGSDTHLPITKTQLVKYIKACRWFDYRSEMTVKVHQVVRSLDFQGIVKFKNEGW